ncbi:phosphoglycerate kinase [Candidatus Magnetaquicoccus inordinatus]|uniref:phosphoglycerate kinase n=1 Tax=Candidatus Magnetaquicoccus inordinatus TaxID=2496818 RepID=UPI00102CCA3F|nr:phosphoglycerate kinase [Candidatus Magnetaquicoccus inordinatus]
MNKLTIDQIDLAGKRVFIRVDFNVPMTENGTIREETRITAAIPTIRRALEKGGRIILASHFGRPEGKIMPEYSLRPVAERLSQLLGQPVALAPDCIGDAVEQMVNALQPGQIILLENVRFHAGETKNNPQLADAFARLADVVVNDAFGAAHRAHASNVGIAQRVTPAVAGLLMADEINYFNRAVRHPQRPVAAILGGSKVSTKIAVIERLLAQVDMILLGGAMAFTFFKARGQTVGSSLVEDEMLQVARDAEEQARARGVKLLLPVDAVIATSPSSTTTQIVSIDAIPEGWMGLDIGPATIQLFQQALQTAATIVWNGPMGVFEKPAFANGTLALAEAVAQCSALSVAGGGDTDAALRQAGVADRISFISTGGGAFMELLEGKELPGIAVLNDA